MKDKKDKTKIRIQNSEFAKTIILNLNYLEIEIYLNCYIKNKNEFKLQQRLILFDCAKKID